MNKKFVARGLCIFIVAAILVLVLCMCTGCGNVQLVDTVYTYNRAIIEMPGGDVIEVDIKKWGDYDGEQLQIIAEDDTVYLVSSYNCILIRD